MVGKSPEVEINPDILKWARESIGYSIQDTAKRMGISDDGVYRWETGEKNPTIKQLKQLATYYKRPLAVFLLPTPPEELPLPHDFRTVYNEDISALSPKTRLAIRYARRLQELTKELEGRSHTSFLDSLIEIKTNSDPEEIAQHIRGILSVSFEEQKTWRRENIALNAWKDKIEKVGILVLQLSWPIEEARAMSFINGGIPLILLNTKDESKGRIFSLFHELAHLLLHKGGICDPLKIHDQYTERGMTRSKKIEKFCNHFAGAFLVPGSILLNHHYIRGIKRPKEWKDHILRKIGRDFVVSNEVILRRLLTFDLTTNNYYSQKHEEWEQSLIKMEEQPSEGGGGRNIPKECIQKNGRLFVNLVIHSYHHNQISSLDVADYLSIQIKHIPGVEKLTGVQ